jgi:hypothetical protein
MASDPFIREQDIAAIEDARQAGVESCRLIAFLLMLCRNNIWFWSDYSIAFIMRYDNIYINSIMSVLDK